MKSPTQIAFTLAVSTLAALSIGCSTTRLSVVGPPGSVLFVDDEPHHLPAHLELRRAESAGQFKRHNVSLVSNVQSQELRAVGHLDLFGYTESDIDKLATNTCVLREQDLARIYNGTVVVFRGQSSSRQPLFELTLAKK